ncbi:Alpha/Beta hydrolase protein [Aspergillus carlsbadensis]|nr:Alpha/Beta hydrolase protein [Aspergillus carlsbadensis]
MATENHKIADFDLIQTTYKHIGAHGIRADILVPKTSFSGKRPTILRFHGGDLVTGDSLYVDFWSHWLSDLALKHDAVIISANHRLLPEANGLDIYEDIEDFWAWVHSGDVESLLSAHSTPTDIDLGRILTAGESAGGLLSINLALSHPKEIRAATGVYASLDLRSTDWTAPRTILPMGMDVPESIFDSAIASVTPGSVVSSAFPPDRIPLLVAGIQHGRLAKLYERGVEESLVELLYPDARLEKEGLELPIGGIALIHGRQDSVVPAVGAERFIEKAREATKGQPVNEKLILSIQEGEHGFDLNLRYDEEVWLQDAVQLAVQAWLQE